MNSSSLIDVIEAVYDVDARPDEVLIQWGPERRRPVLDRMLERFPGITREQAVALEAEARAIADEAYALAERAYYRDGFDQYTGRDELGRRFPQLAPATLNHLWSQGGYYAWHG